MYENFASALFILYDNFEHRHVYRHRKYLEKSQWFRKEDIMRLQTKRVKALLAHAFENVPFYNESFKSVGFHPSHFRTLDDLCKLPVLRKSDVRGNVCGLRARNVSEGNVKAWFTSGTTAAPIKLFRDQVDVGWGVAAELRGFGWAGYDIGDKLALIWNVRPNRARSLKFKIGNKLRRCKFLNISGLSEKSFRSFAAELHHFQPDFIRGHAGAVNLFASFLLGHGKFSIHPKAVFTSCETLLPHYRKTIEAAFECKVYDYYGSVEVSHVGAQCGCGEAFHVTDENVLVEVVKDGECASNDEKGKVLFTNLHGYAMPFIRYDVGDFGRVIGDDCCCGRKLSMLEVLGRTNEYFVNRDGSFVFLKDFQRFFKDVPITDFEVVQSSLDEIIVRIVPKADFSSWHSHFIVRNLKYVGSAKIKLELVDSISPQMSGKIRHVVSKVPTEYA